MPLRISGVLSPLAASASLLLFLSPGIANDLQVTRADCQFLIHTDELLEAESRVRLDVHRAALKLGRMAESNPDPGTIVRRNFIDEEIFGKLAATGVRSAPLAGDEEFLRRVTLDLTGRIPTPEAVRAFSADTDPGKRDALIDRLIRSEAFDDKWTWWLSDLLQVNVNNSNTNRQINGRNAFSQWIRVKVNERASLRDIAWEAVAASGNSFLMENGATNWVINSITPMGPIQDQYDTMFSKTASTFLGMGYYDCILCHSGRGHLEQLSLWGKGATRMEALRMAAFFSRQNIANHPESGVRDSFFAGARVVTDRTAGNYALNTTNGNRPARCAPGGTVVNNRCTATINLDPEYYRTAAKPDAGRSWREAFADQMVNDPMFARNFANRLWKEMFQLGLVDPVDALDPARLDPNQPPGEGWELQATHPQLLEKLAASLRAGNYSFREYLKLLASSSAYQLSSRYGGEWNITSVPLFARHYPRRLEGEEIHDAIAAATGVMATYPVQGFPSNVNWAMQLPDPAEPRSNGAVAAFLNVFLRGNRDNQPRSQAGSILQQLALKNDNFVLSRVKVAVSPRLRAIANTADPEAAASELFLSLLGRAPSALERSQAIAILQRAPSGAARNTAVEDLAWTLINKVEFLYSY